MEILQSSNGRIDIVVTDLMMEGMDGIRVLEKAKELKPEISVLLLTGYGTMQSVVNAMRLGAYDYMLKPCNQEELLLRLEKCAERIELENQVRRHTSDIEKMNRELQFAVTRYQELEIALRKSMDDLSASNNRLQMISTLDGLTGISNRRFFDEYIEREWSLVMRNNLAMSLIFIDVDFFKLFNDVYGHQAGDDCLMQVAHTINKSLKRPADLAARYGGEEFVVVLPGTDKEGALGLAHAIRSHVEALAIPHSGSSANKYVTISLGVGVISQDRSAHTADLIKIADDALYKAKHNGRNRVETI
jgi:diguanylate cyclase (GGDEF)-like protein